MTVVLWFHGGHRSPRRGCWTRLWREGSFWNFLSASLQPESFRTCGTSARGFPEFSFAGKMQLFGVFWKMGPPGRASGSTQPPFVNVCQAWCLRMAKVSCPDSVPVFGDHCVFLIKKKKSYLSSQSTLGCIPYGSSSRKVHETYGPGVSRPIFQIRKLRP